MSRQTIMGSEQPGSGPGLNFLTQPEPGKNPYPSHGSQSMLYDALAPPENQVIQVIRVYPGSQISDLSLTQQAPDLATRHDLGYPGCTLITGSPFIMKNWSRTELQSPPELIIATTHLIRSIGVVTYHDMEDSRFLVTRARDFATEIINPKACSNNKEKLTLPGYGTKAGDKDNQPSTSPEYPAMPYLRGVSVER
ncbi:hypothetical protein ARMGADRAFT_1028375 [Armillaria gallica]|uniref:Uncharacterized protein n=1 Tax=Armillaria gallica TaxID=47427 RepID=A0A2H3E949_ARMGA|nr:hypothetical protein ARMGADRAFT_1028375 [Armillaria gallica]